MEDIKTTKNVHGFWPWVNQTYSYIEIMFNYQSNTGCIQFYDIFFTFISLKI